MANIRDIATGVRESARFYVELHKLGVNIQCFDVGGGLGVDYEGTRSQSDCSVNYGLNEYANNIIWAIGDACEENGLPHPTVITESGRAVFILGLIRYFTLFHGKHLRIFVRHVYNVFSTDRADKDLRLRRF